MAETLVNVPFRTMVERCLKAVNVDTGSKSNRSKISRKQKEGDSKEKDAANKDAGKENDKIKTVVNHEVIKRFLRP